MLVALDTNIRIVRVIGSSLAYVAYVNYDKVPHYGYTERKRLLEIE